ncbi:hypothetical protein KIK06_07935 [Nocardiopsis sp. EMB25]|uniref:hypothetical protein n=1 Tax=Nocardiopsis sp. EMB25 TaxID=2835867 RepID=UPI0022840070|nr:hypothetical protein [Nocardiopsis sp. EMB25]MCY9783818.1 hypothetical protein [Nocardiopsis sp. EMB25]
MTNERAAVVAALASAVVLAGCAVDTSGFRRGPIPENDPTAHDATGPFQLDLPPEPGSDAAFGESIAWEALAEVSEFAGTTDPEATYTCPTITGQDRQVTCTVTFLGDSYDYVVTIEDSWEFMPEVIDQTWLQYTAELPAGPVVRDVVEDYLRWSGGTEYVLCDLPEVTGAAVGEEVGTCEAVDEDGYGTRRATIVVGEYGFLARYT